jgi:hypothetical protein
MTKGSGVDTKLAVVVEKVSNIEQKITKMESKLDAEYVTRGEMNARVALLENNISILQKIVYGVVSLILTAVIGGMVVFYINIPK